MSQIKRALLSVSDKTGIVEFAKGLVDHGIQIISTGGTFRILQEANVPVMSISEVTHFPEILDGRVKTLHPAVHGGLLAIRDDKEHRQQLRDHQIEPIDLVVVNLYPFQKTVEKEDVTLSEAIENIDIGGPTLLRAAAKNHQDVTVLVDPADYPLVMDQIASHRNTDLETRFYLATKAFEHTAAYDALISGYFRQIRGEDFPEQLTLTYRRQQSLRYGENPHQQAAFYHEPLASSGTLANCKQLQGKELSYNNINDASAALELVREFQRPTVVAVKHMNPCGVAEGETIADAFRTAYEADPVSIFGGIIAANRVIDQKTAEQMVEIFLEIVIAPGFEPEALEILRKKQNLRLLQLDLHQTSPKTFHTVSVDGGLLVQEADQKEVTQADCQVVTKRKPDAKEWEQLLFAWKVVKHVKSNAIVLAKNAHTIGVGAGQMNRVGAAEIAIRQAGEQAKGSVLASDAFFPMPDTVEKAIEAGVTAIIQPGGSIRDQESIDRADQHGIAMVFTGVRHFKH